MTEPKPSNQQKLAKNDHGASDEEKPPQPKQFIFTQPTTQTHPQKRHPSAGCWYTQTTNTTTQPPPQKQRQYQHAMAHEKTLKKSTLAHY